MKTKQNLTLLSLTQSFSRTLIYTTRRHTKDPSYILIIISNDLVAQQAYICQKPELHKRRNAMREEGRDCGKRRCARESSSW